MMRQISSLLSNDSAKTASLLFIGIMILMGLFMTSTALAQYFNERVLEKSFEQTDFFFKPSYLNPYGIGGFGSAAPGLFDDPLLNLIINPAYLTTDSGSRHYAYMDFRNSQEIQDQPTIYPHSYYNMTSSIAVDYRVYPIYYIDSRKELEPVFSGAYMARPFGNRLGGLSFAATYQIILQDDNYYDIPQDIYRSNQGYDYAGNRMWESSDIPITDRYSGTDEMHQEGHFASFFTGFSPFDRLNLGFRLSRVFFNRDGGFGSQNVWKSGYYGSGSSASYYMNQRGQDYDHWDASGGLHVRLSGATVLGVMAGTLWGDAVQEMAGEDSSLYDYGTIGVGPDWSYYYRSGVSDRYWKHDGSSTYGGVNLSSRVGKGRVFNFYYRVFKENVDISLNSALRDTSYSNYHHEDSDWEYDSESRYTLIDSRTGSGTREGFAHTLAAVLQWQIESRVQLDFGIHVDHRTKHTMTSEHVFADRHTGSEWSNLQQEREYYSATTEDKELLWDFKSIVTNIQIPLILRYRLSKPIEILFGVTRSMKRWTLTDETLAIFDYRTVIENETTTHRENFGERYTMPEEKRSDVTTSILGGLTISATKHFNVRFLVVPQFIKTYDGTELSTFQWWIDFSLFP